jgi:(E)-4-hydroxy-3-methylbut-2-enyl-diphosphate synthase
MRKVTEACRKKNIPIRIGINSGSLEKNLLPLYHKDPAAALIESARRNVAILESLDFTDIVLSLKATDPLVTIDAYRRAARVFPYPLHLGLTEAGSLFSGTIRSSAALGILLSEGIGDTIRVSLTADAVEEIRVAKELLAAFGLYKKPTLISKYVDVSYDDAFGMADLNDNKVKSFSRKDTLKVVADTDYTPWSGI